MKIDPKEALQSLAITDSPFQTVFEYGTLSAEIYQPEIVDLPQPHTRDEAYVVISGTGEFLNDAVRTNFGPGDFLFMPAGLVHRFENFTEDFSTWVFLYGPEGGQAGRVK